MSNIKQILELLLKYETALRKIFERECICGDGEGCDCAWEYACEVLDPERYAELQKIKQGVSK